MPKPTVWALLFIIILLKPLHAQTYIFPSYDSGITQQVRAVSTFFLFETADFGRPMVERLYRTKLDSISSPYGIVGYSGLLNDFLGARGTSQVETYGLSTAQKASLWVPGQASTAGELWGRLRNVGAGPLKLSADVQALGGSEKYWDRIVAATYTVLPYRNSSGGVGVAGVDWYYDSLSAKVLATVAEKFQIGFEYQRQRLSYLTNENSVSTNNDFEYEYNRFYLNLINLSLFGKKLPSVNLYNNVTFSGTKIEETSLFYQTPLFFLPFVAYDYIGPYGVTMASLYGAIPLGPFEILVRPQSTVNPIELLNVDVSLDWTPLFMALMSGGENVQARSTLNPSNLSHYDEAGRSGMIVVVSSSATYWKRFPFYVLTGKDIVDRWQFELVALRMGGFIPSPRGKGLYLGLDCSLSLNALTSDRIMLDPMATAKKPDDFINYRLALSMGVPL